MRVPYLKRENQRDALHRVVPAVDKVAHEHEVRVRRRAPNLEDLDKIVKLAMDVADYGARRWHVLHVALPLQDLGRAAAEILDLRLCQLLLTEQLGHLATQKQHQRAVSASRAWRCWQQRAVESAGGGAGLRYARTISFTPAKSPPVPLTIDSCKSSSSLRESFSIVNIVFDPAAAGSMARSS